MIAGILHSGSGIGNQLHRYVATRVLAKKKGYNFTMVAPENSKVKDFMNLDMGKKDYPINYHTEQPSGKVIPAWVGNEWEEKTLYYNPEFNFIEDGTIIDGEFQDERYFEEFLPEIDEWLKVEPLDIPDDTCVIGFRGGEFTAFPDLFLTPDYWQEGINIMAEKGIIKFEVHTDDPITARQCFPNLKVIHDPALNWRAMRYAKHAIIANSSFYILPRLLSDGHTIAPRYWARRNTKQWSMPQNYYHSFQYV